MTSTSRQRYEGNGTKKKMSKEQLQLALTKKKECDARALTIVERSIETEIEEKWLLENLENLNRCHMEDIVEERALQKRCGYPLCDNILMVKINQRYHISTRSNKVYDVSKRKNFCSNNCYGATNYLIEQMFDTPLWLRDPNDKPQFHLLPVAGLKRKSTPGDEVDLGRENITVIDQTKPAESRENLTNNDAKDTSRNKFDDDLDRVEKAMSENLKLGEPVLAVPEKKLIVESEDMKPRETVAPKRDEKCKDIVVEREVKLDGNVSTSIRRVKKKREKISGETKLDPNWIVGHIENYLEEWLTLESLVILLGDAVFKEKKIEEIEKEAKDEVVKKKYVELCQKVDKLQIDGDSDDEDMKTDLKPLPNYDVLKEEGEKLEVKVRAFYDGKTIVETPTTTSSNPSNEKKDGDSRTFLPLRGEHDPKMLRRRIVLEKLDKVLPEMLRTLAGCEFIVNGSIESNGCGDSVKALVNTFSLSASNVIPKPAEWNLLGLVFLKLLSISEPRLRFLLATDRAKKYTTMILMSYNLEPNYLDRLVATFTDVKNYRDRNSVKDSKTR